MDFHFKISGAIPFTLSLNIDIPYFLLTANCIVMALDEHLPNGDKTLLALQLVSHHFFIHVLILNNELFRACSL